MKKLALLLAVLMIMSAMLVACSKKNKGDDENDETKDPGIVDGETSGETTGETSTEADSEDETDTYVEPTSFTFTECEETPIYVITPVNLRTQPSTSIDDGKISVAADTELIKIAESNETVKKKDGNEYKWFKVKYQDKEWYVVSLYVTSLSNPDEGFVAVEKTLYLNVKSISLRQFPNTENAAVGYIYKGYTVKVVAENTEIGWYKIEFEGSTYTPAGQYYISADASFFSETPVEVETEAEG